MEFPLTLLLLVFLLLLSDEFNVDNVFNVELSTELLPPVDEVLDDDEVLLELSSSSELLLLSSHIIKDGGRFFLCFFESHELELQLVDADVVRLLLLFLV